MVFLVSFIVYLFTLAPTVYGLDSAEFSTVAYKLGVPHATGYPLYVVLGKLFTYLPVGDIAYRINLMSAVFAAGAATVVYRLAFLSTGRVAASMAAAGLLAFSYYFWASAVVAEVYTLHAFLTATVMYLLFRWHRGRSNLLLYAAGFFWGLSFGNHMSTALLGPAFAYLVVSGLWQGRIKWQNVAILAAWFVPALGIYLYLPWRYLANAVPYVLGRYTSNGEFERVDATSVRGMWWILTAQQFDVFMFSHRGLEYVTEVGRSLWWLFANFLGIGLVLGLFGIVRNWTCDRWRLVFMGLVVLFNVLFFASYGASDKQVMLLPAYVVWAVWVAEGIAYITRFLESRSDRRGQRAAAGSVWTKPGVVRWGTTALALPAIAMAVNFSYADVSSDTVIRDSYTEILTDVEPNALILAWWPDSSPMYYLQQVENIRPDVQIIDRFLIDPEDEKRLIESTLPNRPVYVFGHLPTMSFRYEAVPVYSAGDLAHKLSLPGTPITNPP